ncbi:hypothetical protein K1719_012597 [Acacia pycnantha]|nr:hypothetical protein K1719_012597 [Acacia pycnantha]
MALVPAGKKSPVVPPSAEDDELLRRSSKKIKNGNNLGSSEEWPSLGPRKEGKPPSISFADKLKGTSSTMMNGVNGLSDNMMDADPISESDSEQEDNEPVVQKPNRKKRNEKDIQLESNHSQNRGSRFGILSVKDVGSEEVNLGENERVPLGAGGSEKASDEVMHANSFVPEAIEVLPSRGNKGSSLKKNQKKKNPVGEKGAVQGSRQVQRSVKRIREPVQKVAAAKEVLCLPYEELQPGDEKEKVSTGEKSFTEHTPDQDKMEQDVFLEASQEIDSLGLVQGFPGKFWDRKESNEPEDEVVEETPHDLIEGGIGLYWLCLQKPKWKTKLGCNVFFCWDLMEWRLYLVLAWPGGLVAVWRSDRVDVAIDGLDRQFIHLKCSFDGGSPFFFTSIYSIPHQCTNKLLWNAYLEGYASVIVHPWVVMGDFNDIAMAMEKSGGSGGVESRMCRFTDRLQRCRLSDLGSCGPKFTWKGPVSVGGCRIFERLDRALGSTVGDFDGHSRQVLSCAFKPTRPFRIVSCGEDFLVNFYDGPPFKFNMSIRDHSNFVNCVRFSPDGTKFITVSSDRNGNIYDGKSGDKLGELSAEGGHKGSIYAVSWSPDSKQV